ncbi:predicted protein [Uncinocarpus reesii 1704]|uniref:Uncharacterized protein n=1 Tax=Uncinocarpus reesii (strain UAMH 1704) TaxID=336963 RepID=C4JW83_UNCRE|nr:uncharacterized protein UREG_06825 [Uncinocarpus reesii 1704]EEP81960.1 predicted protein [Uncinocarpus reesii 1704]
MMEWLAETWIIRILFFLIAYYAANSQIDRATRKADSAEHRARQAERALENSLSDIRINANECVELRKRVSYLEEKMDEYGRVLEALSVPIPTMSMEDVSERVVSHNMQNGPVDVKTAVGMVGAAAIPLAGAPPRIENLSILQQHPQHYIIRSFESTKERGERSASSSEESTSSAGEKINNSLRSRFESSKESVMSVLSNFPGRKNNRGSKAGGLWAGTIYSPTPGGTFIQRVKRSQSKATTESSL